METVDIHPLTRQAVCKFLGDRLSKQHGGPVDCKRRANRWPFPGTVELWLPCAGGGDRYALATSINLSEDGIGVKFDEPLEPGIDTGIAFHEPEASFHGYATVRHCTELEDETYFIGMQFRFDDD